MDIFNILFQFATHLPLILGAYVLFLILRYPDLTIEASWSIGAIVSCIFLQSNILPPYLAFLMGGFTGILCGLLTSGLFVVTGRAKLLAGLISYYILEAIGFHLLGDSAMIFVDDNSLKNFGFQDNRSIALLIYTFISLSLFVLIYFWQNEKIGIKTRLLGENPKSSIFHNFNINKYYSLGLILGNLIVGLGGGLWGTYYATATNLQGIGLVIKAFIAILIGDAIIRKLKIAKRPVPAAALIGTFVFVVIIHISEVIQLFVAKNFDITWFKATDKQIIVAVVLLILLNWRRNNYEKKELVSDW